MVFVDIELNDAYWKSLEINQEDIEFLYSHLLEKEKPLPSSELAEALVKDRIRLEREAFRKKQQQNGEIYAPQKNFSVGDKIQFPAMNWVSGHVTDVREGINPEYDALKVITVDLENGQKRLFASNLQDHKLNQVMSQPEDTLKEDEKVVIQKFGDEITNKLEEKLDENKDLVRIGPNWFPKSLLIEFNIGHLNLAEAVLDMHQGGPLAVDELLEQLEVNTDDPAELVRFSLNYALKEDPRFDDVGPSGNVEWFLNRLEPMYVREKPIQLLFSPSDYDRSQLSEDMLRAEQNVDDEFIGDDPRNFRKQPTKEVTIALNYPHWRVGSLPLTPYTHPFFPTALESPRVKFKFIDAKGQEISAWVVRPYSYVYGLKAWYDDLELMPGSLIKIRKSNKPGQVFIEAQKKRSNREWIRTLLIGADGGVVFAMLKQTITADYNERMAIAVPATDGLDELWQKRVHNPRPLKDEIITTMRELAKLNPQGHVHAVELYAALNCIRRCPPGLVFSMLSSSPEFSAVGDLYFRLSEEN